MSILHVLRYRNDPVQLYPVILVKMVFVHFNLAFMATSRYFLREA
jgi:hypothetical protein